MEMFFGVPPTPMQPRTPTNNLVGTSLPMAGIPAIYDPLFWSTAHAFALPPHQGQREAMTRLASLSTQLSAVLPLLLSPLQRPSPLIPTGTNLLMNLLQQPLTASQEMLRRLREQPLLSPTEQQLLQQAQQAATMPTIPEEVRQRWLQTVQEVLRQNQQATDTLKRTYLDDLQNVLRLQRQQLTEQAAASGLLSSGGHLEATRRMMETMGREASAKLAELELERLQQTLPLQQQALQTEAQLLSQTLAQRPDWMRLALSIATLPAQRLQDLAQLIPNLEMAMRTALLQPISLALEQGLRQEGMGLDWLRTGLGMAETLRSLLMAQAALGETMRGYEQQALERAYEDWLRRQEIFQHLPFTRLVTLFQLLQPQVFQPTFAPSTLDQLWQLLPLLLLPRQEGILPSLPPISRPLFILPSPQGNTLPA